MKFFSQTKRKVKYPGISILFIFPEAKINIQVLKDTSIKRDPEDEDKREVWIT